MKERWYEHEHKTVLENDSATILWDMPIHTDRTIAVNRPDIVLKNKKDKTCLLIDMTVPLDTKIGNWWGLKTTTVAVVMGALGTIKKDMENSSDKIPGNINIYENTRKYLSFLQPTFSAVGPLHNNNNLQMLLEIGLFKKTKQNKKNTHTEKKNIKRKKKKSKLH